jgi:multidrug efflux pump subunit AcrB
VFLPAFSLVGVPRQLFVPLALAVTLAMAASYVLSSTLVPVLAAWWLRTHTEESGSFDRLKTRYAALLDRVLAARIIVVLAYLVACGVVLALLLPRLGVELFPVTGGDQLQMRLRAPAGTRIERTEPLTLRVLEEVKPSSACSRPATRSTPSTCGRRARTKRCCWCRSAPKPAAMQPGCVSACGRG